MNKITVIGPIPRDTIITHKNETIHKYGFATHAAVALAKLMEDRGEIIVISHVHKKDEQAIKVIFAPFHNVNLKGLDVSRDRVTVIELRFLD